MMRTIIIEDEPLVAKDLEKLIRKTDPQMEILQHLSTLQQSIEWFKQHPEEPDVLFMDIQLADGISFDLFKSVQLNCPIIFTTAFNEYALRAFKLNSIDYLLKPIDADELKAAIDKLRKYRSQNIELGFGDRVKNLLQMMEGGADNSKKYKERFMVSSRNAIMPLHYSEIAGFEKNELVYIHTFSGQKLIADYDTLDEIEHLADPHFFFRANRQFIIHIDAVEKYTSGVNSKLHVKLKAPISSEIEISREKAATFKHWLDR